MSEKLCCLIHSDREAIVSLQAPCMPGGMVHLCYECAKLEHRKLLFEAEALERLKAAVSARGYREAVRKRLN